MYKFRYFDGSELVMTISRKQSELMEIARKSNSVYQIVRNNRTQEIIWERECQEI